MLFSSYREPERRFSEKVEKVEFDADYPQRRREPERRFSEKVEFDVDYPQRRRESERRFSENVEFGVDFPQHRHQERELPIRRPAAEFGPSEASFVEESSSFSRHTPTVVDTFERRYSEPREDVRVEIEATVDAPVRHTESTMGFHDDEGQYHSFRHGLHRAADRILHPLHHRHHHHGGSVHEDVYIDARIQETGPSSTISGGSVSRRGIETVPIPCHHVRAGDILYLQGRPCQVIRITTSAQTGQHRYLGVDLFTKQLHEDTSIVSHPSPSVLLQTMQGPIFKQYRLLDVREDGRVVAMTENGDVKQSLRVADQGSLWARLNDAFADGRGSVRVLVLRDGPDELAVDFKLVHGSRL